MKVYLLYANVLNRYNTYICVYIFTRLIKRNAHVFKSASSLAERIMYISVDFKHAQKSKLCLQHQRNYA